MSEQRDGSAPPRKRRRPALSCEQCRKRKIKCDRNYPCSHCIQSKTANCSYQDSIPLPSSHVSSDLPLRPTSSPPESGIGGPACIPSENSTSHVIWSTKHTVAPDVDNVLYPPSSTRPHSDAQQPASRQSLQERVEMLERKLKSATNGFSRTERRPREKHLQGALEQKELHGTISKTRFFGSSHWMHSFGMFDRIASLTVDPNSNKWSPENTKKRELSEGVAKCKALAKQVKSKPHKEWLTNPNFRDTFPPRGVCDQLIAIYFRTSESLTRVLHRPTFFKEYAEYWDNPAEASTVNVLKILLVMSLGACLYQAPDSAVWRRQALQWIFAAQTWLASPFEKGRLHISGLQVYCLVLMARVDNAVAGDLIWISAGALLRTAFQMGFHRDPKYLPGIKPLHAELRRRLWATILEWNVQSALDSGMPPLISMDDFDTEPPSNLDDSDMDEDTTTLQPKPDDVYTQTSVQRILMKSLASRLEVVRQANNFHFESSYEEVLELGSQLTSNCKEQNAFVSRVNATSPSAPKISQLQHNLLDLWVRRFLLALHRPYAIKAQKDPHYYFSRKVSLDCAMTMMKYPADNVPLPLPGDAALDPTITDDYTRLTIMSGNFYKSLFVHAALIIWSEILTQLEEESPSFSEQSRAAREPLKQALRHCRELSAKRVTQMENNIKGHLFISIVIAQIEALEAGQNPDWAVLEAGTDSVRLCYDLLSKRFAADSALRGEGSISGLGDPIFTPGTTGTTPEFSFDFNMGNGVQDWVGDFSIPDSWLLSGWGDNNSW